MNIRQTQKNQVFGAEEHSSALENIFIKILGSTAFEHGSKELIQRKLSKPPVVKLKEPDSPRNRVYLRSRLFSELNSTQGQKETRNQLGFLNQS